MAWIKKLIKNKTATLIVCVIVISLVYMGVQRAIAHYNFKNNNDIVVEESGVVASDRSNVESSEGTTQSEPNENDENSVEEEGEISSEETDLVLEEVEENATEERGVELLDASAKEVQSKIYVYITGEVNNPGVVVLNAGSRIVDAINAAGGTTVKADISKVNLVYILEDGMKVNIPNNSDLKNNSDFEYITMNSGDGRNDDYMSSNESTDSGTKEEKFSSKRRYDVVNINTATQTELETLPGIGPSLALKIINHRKENGKFSSIEQIKDVSGIGESKFESLKDYITI